MCALCSSLGAEVVLIVANKIEEKQHSGSMHAMAFSKTQSIAHANFMLD